MIHRVLLAILLASCAVAHAQSPGFKRTVLQRTDLGGGHEVLLMKIEIEAGGTSGRHTHHGVEAGYVAAGEIRFEVEGEGTRVVKAGDHYMVPMGRVHNATAVKPTTLVGTLSIEKGKPLATPAP